MCMEGDRVHRLNPGGWDLWVAVYGVTNSVEDVWLNVFFRGFLNTLARARWIINQLFISLV